MAGTVLDLSLYTHGDSKQKAEFAQALLQNCAQYGFLRLVNHGISDEDVSRLFDWTQKFFTLSTSEKTRLAHPPGPEPQRGWSCVGAERTSKLYRSGLGEKNVDEDLFDAREHFDVGSPEDRDWPSRWPDDGLIPGFRSFMEQYYRSCQDVSNTILEALEVAAQLPPGSFTTRCSHGASELRLNHYPAINIKELRSGTVNRIWPHTDLGVITCLFQDNTGGLEMENRQEGGTFIPVMGGSESEMIVSISETFTRWTNATVKAAVHRVEVAPHLKDLESGIIPQRFSNAFFVKADRDVMVGPLHQFISEKKPALYDDMTALQYHQYRVAQAYRRQPVTLKSH